MLLVLLGLSIFGRGVFGYYFVTLAIGLFAEGRVPRPGKVGDLRAIAGSVRGLPPVPAFGETFRPSPQAPLTKGLIGWGWKFLGGFERNKNKGVEV